MQLLRKIRISIKATIMMVVLFGGAISLGSFALFDVRPSGSELHRHAPDQSHAAAWFDHLGDRSWHGPRQGQRFHSGRDSLIDLDAASHARGAAFFI